MTTTRLPNGISTADSESSMGSLIIPTPQNPFVLFDDFNILDSTKWETTLNLNEVLELVGSQAVGGTISLTTTNAAGLFTFNTLSFQHEFVKGKETWFEINVFTTDTDDLSDASFTFGIGLEGSADTVQLFYDEDADTLSILAKEDTGSTSETKVVVSNLTSLFPTADVRQVFSFHYDGADRITAYVDNVAVGFISSASIPFGIQLPVKAQISGFSAAIRTYNIDYILAAQER